MIFTELFVDRTESIEQCLMSSDHQEANLEVPIT